MLWLCFVFYAFSVEKTEKKKKTHHLLAKVVSSPTRAGTTLVDNSEVDWDCVRKSWFSKRKCSRQRKILLSPGCLWEMSLFYSLELFLLKTSPKVTARQTWFSALLLLHAQKLGHQQEFPDTCRKSHVARSLSVLFFLRVPLDWAWGCGDSLPPASPFFFLHSCTLAVFHIPLFSIIRDCHSPPKPNYYSWYKLLWNWSLYIVFFKGHWLATLFSFFC